MFRETPAWVSEGNQFDDGSLTIKEKHDKIIEEVYVPKNNHNIMDDLGFVKAVSLTHEGTYHYPKVEDQRKDLKWVLVKSGTSGVNEVSQVIDVSNKNTLHVTLLEHLNEGKEYNGYGKIYGLDSDKKFKEVIVDNIMPKESYSETYDISEFSYIVMHIPFSSHKGWKVSFDDINYVDLIMSKHKTIIRPEDLDFGLTEGTYWNSYQGSVVTLDPNQTVPEWGTTEAVRVKTTGGNSSTKYYLNPELKGVPGSPDIIYFSVIHIKNNGTIPVKYSNNTGVIKMIEPGESKRVLMSKRGESNRHRQISFGTEKGNQPIDITLYGLYFTELTSLNI